MNPAKDNAVVPCIRGDRYRQTHKASVIGVLGAKCPRVSSRGSRFYNRDRWTVRFLTSEMCKWAKGNPGCIPTRVDIKKWVDTANSQRVYDPEIVIANTPDQLPLRVALALTGGAYHEAWHTLYSRRDDLTVDEVAAFVLPRWALVKDWSKFHQALLDWSNVVEDIRIERRGREDFEGAFVKMCDLQDFILDMEAKGQESVRSHGGKPRALSTIVCVFRDVGLGYNTDKQRAAMDRYRKDNPKAVDMVLGGPLAVLLHEAIDLARKDDTGSLRVAMDVLAIIAEVSSEDQDSDEQGKDGKPGDGKQKCPACGAPADKLVVRPISDGRGGKVKGMGMATCLVCGYQQEVPVQIKPPKAKPDPADKNKPKEKGPKFEGFDESDVTEPEEGGGDEGDETEDKKPGKGKGKKDDKKPGGDDKKPGKDEGEGDDEGDEKPGKGDKKPGEDEGDKKPGKGKKDKGDEEGGDKKPSKDKDGKPSKDKGEDKDEGAGDEDEDGDDAAPGEDGDPEDGADGEGEDGDGDETGGDAGDETGDSDGAGDEGGDEAGGKAGDTGDEAGDTGDEAGDGAGDSDGDRPEGVGEQKDDQGESGKGGNGAGGHQYQEQADGDDDWTQVADEAVDQAKDGEDLGLKDGNTALEEAVGGANDKEEGDVLKGEAPWCPYDPGLDVAELVRPSRQGKEHDAKQAEDLLKTVRREIAYLRARLRTIIRALEMTSVDHGVPKGRRLSSQYLVDTRASVLAHDQPRRAYDQPGIQLDMSFAAVVIVDESGSMSSLRQDVTRIFCSVTEPFDGLGCATMAMGFRNGKSGPFNRDPLEVGNFHRTEGVHYDIFKNWNERFSAVKWRFANTVAMGGTPMADGIQFALDAISRRDEANRVIFVVTDGCPDWGHELIIRRQIRLAREAGIYIIGVGLGSSSRPVLTLFDDSVFAEKVKDIPKLLVEKLNRIVDAYGTKRGRRVKKTT